MEWSPLLSSKRVGELLGKEPSEADTRTAFERDYGRAIFSTPLRRLQDKTQVFPLEEHDAVRTRLTHSLEVSSVARSLGRQVGGWVNSRGDCKQEHIHDLETVAATAGLIHDLGNPPFGHAGENAIRTWFQERDKRERPLVSRGELQEEDSIFSTLGSPNEAGAYNEQHVTDFLRWEGNAQTLRLVSRLQVLADDYGINLTCATYPAACKYLSPSNKLNRDKHECSKPGFFASEAEVVSRVAEETGTKGARNPITYLVEASDDIVYCTGDLEDGVKKGLIDWEFLKEELQAEIPGNLLLEKTISKAEKKVRYDARERPVRNEEVAQAFRTFAIGEIKEAVFEQFCLSYADIMSGTYHRELVKDPQCQAAALVQACKRVGFKHVYQSPTTLKLELMGRRVIHDLMDIFWEGAAAPDSSNEFSKKALALISSNYKKVFSSALREGTLPERYCRLQLVTDQIAGMTDTYAIMLHKRLMNG